jgi:hypothetical protein
MMKGDQLFSAVRKVLLEEWDPIGVAHYPKCSNEYDRYVRTICRFLVEGVDGFKLTAYLSQVRTVSMGLSLAYDGREKLVARRLLELLV